MDDGTVILNINQLIDCCARERHYNLSLDIMGSFVTLSSFGVSNSEWANRSNSNKFNLDSCVISLFWDRFFGIQGFD